MTSVTQQLAEQLTNIGVKAAYGDPVEVGGATIVPVAVTSFGFGGGEGGPEAVEPQPSGGGGGGMALPVGAYITRNGTTRFEPNPVALLAVTVPLAWITGRTIAKVVKILKT